MLLKNAGALTEKMGIMVMRRAIESGKDKPLFRLFFLKDNDDQSVEVVEVEEIDFREVERRLQQEESVFITRKREQEMETSLVADEDVAKPWYLTRE